MRSHRLHLGELAVGTRQLHGTAAHYLGTVRRAAPGDALELFDGAGTTAQATIQSVQAGVVTIQITAVTTHEVTGLQVHLAPALLKGDKLANVVRPATELGVASIIPVITRRADVKVLSPNKHQRLVRVAEEASRQSERVVVPTVHEAVALEAARLPGTILVAQPGAVQPIIAAATQLAGQEFTVVTGPEGGLASEEVAWLVTQLGATPVSLGTTILRAETAPVAALAALQLWSEAQ